MSDAVANDIETVPAEPKHLPEISHGGVIPMAQTNIYPPTQPDAMGFTGLAARVVGIPIIAIFMTFYIFNWWDDRTMKREKAADDKVAAIARDAQIEKFHRDFQEHDEKKWQAIEKNSDAIKSVVEEVKRGNIEIQMKMSTLIEEVKKGKMGGGIP